jgi:hypothetical protein
MKKHRDANASDQLGDNDLLEREVSERREFLRLERREPHLRETNYRALNASPGLMRAWERWNLTNTIARLRGLLMRGS